MPVNWWPIGFFFILVAGFALAALTLSRVIAPNKPSKVKQETYESGIQPAGQAQQRSDIRYYTIAMLFVLFDIEAVFLYPWAVVFDRIGLYGFIEIVLFIVLLLAAYAYAWRRGALDW